MNKLWLIIQREYLSRVKKKSFIIATLLTPIAFGLLMFGSGYLAAKGGNESKSLLVKDDGNYIANYIDTSGSAKYTFSDADINSLKESYADDGYDMLIHIPVMDSLSVRKMEAQFYSSEKPSLITVERIENRISRAIEKYKLANSTVDKSTIDGLKMSITLENGKVRDGETGKDEGKGDASSKAAIGIATGLSGFMGFLMYMVIFIYGSMVMRSVMEEKINRIVEVMISSVKPVYLMLGKIIGVGLVGLTQLIIWIGLILIIFIVASSYFGMDAASSMASNPEAAELMKQANDSNFMSEMFNEVKSLNWALILPAFIVYFLGGYFIYSSLFAAVGSAIGDDLGEGQQLTMPIVIPVIMAMLMLQPVLSNPNGPLAVFGSMFPLFSPILMPARLPFDPPLWQVGVSMLILIASVVLFAWIAGRIYRVGIFMYGKKVSFKEIGKWLFYKG